MVNRLKGCIICSKCGREVFDVAEIIFEDDMPVCTNCIDKPKNEIFLKANELQLKKWDEGEYK